jgi:uncharacterized protein YegJ (DUF2314 family)
MKRASAIFAAGLLGLPIAACDRSSDPQTTGAPPAAVGNHQSPWRGEVRSAVISVGDESVKKDLAAAIAQARATAADARLRWMALAPQDRARWAVKWAAPVAPADADATDADDSGGVEHVWVRPINWSPFRIEGVLASEPVQAIAGGKSLGDVVSFPIDELSDWVCFAGDAKDSLGDTSLVRPVEGGFTLEILESRYGRP